MYGMLQTLEREESPFGEEERLRLIRKPLLDWYHKNRRILPWREEPLPYRVWVSEIMLQQTRVEAVKPYFARFMEALPDVKALAEADEETIMKLWEGLGYYSRVRNLQKAAKQIMENGGRIPDNYKELLKLPGVGSYTAGAIASIAYHEAVPAVDGNVLRVLSRLFKSREEIDKPAVKKQMEALVQENMETHEPGDYNQALIELGALVCIPAGKPLCAQCPLQSLCLASREGLTDEIPVRAEKKKRKQEKKTVFVIEWQDRAAIRKRADKGLLAALYELPNLEGHIRQEEVLKTLGLASETAVVELLPSAVHIFTHIEWHMIGYRVTMREERTDLFQMVKKVEIFEKYPIPNAFAMYTKALM